MDLGVRIATWRSHKKLTQQALADAADVTVSAVSYWESGDTSPSQDHLEAVVKALGLTMERFYGRVPGSARAS